MRTPSPLVARSGRAPLIAALATVLVAAVVLVLGGRHFGGDSGSAAVERAATTTSNAPRIRLVQANLRIGTPVKKFQADVRRVLHTKPDFVTYNEVAHRHDVVLAPKGYAIWRGPGVYRGETAVVWNSRRWSAVAHGTTIISDQRGTAGHRTAWGVRWANWVTLHSHGGMTLSVIATHFAPDTKATTALVRPSAQRLGALSDRLARRGPVLVGGDLNASYHSSRYPRSIFTRHQLVPTYDVLRKRAITSGTNVTIDYLLARGVSRFAIGHQFTLSLNSDHNAVGADFTPLPASIAPSPVRFGNGTVLAVPNARKVDQQAIPRMALKAIRSTPKGAAIHLATSRLQSASIANALLAARRRGVHVQFITGDAVLTRGESRLASTLHGNVRANNFAVSKPAAFAKLPGTTVLVSRTGATPAFRLTSAVPLTPAGARGWRRAVMSAQKAPYDTMFRSFFRAVGRKV